MDQHAHGPAPAVSFLTLPISSISRARTTSSEILLDATACIWFRLGPIPQPPGARQLIPFRRVQVIQPLADLRPRRDPCPIQSCPAAWRRPERSDPRSGRCGRSVASAGTSLQRPVRSPNACNPTDSLWISRPRFNSPTRIGVHAVLRPSCSSVSAMVTNSCIPSARPSSLGALSSAAGPTSGLSSPRGPSFPKAQGQMSQNEQYVTLCNLLGSVGLAERTPDQQL